MAVLAHLGDQDARAAALGFLEGVDHLRIPRDGSALPANSPVDAGNGWISAWWRPKTFSMASD
jgi:hypothetical protein